MPPVSSEFQRVETSPSHLQKTMNPKKRPICASMTTVFFLLIALSSLCMILQFERIVNAKISENDSEAFKSWNRKSSPSKFTIYLYNLTNSDQVLAGERPHLAMIGPYVYWKKEEKLNVTWIEVDGSPAISYMKRNSYFLDPDLSSGDPKKDRIISANLPVLALSAAENSGRGPGAVTIDLVRFFANPKLFTKESVHGFLWGYEDSIITLCKMFYPELCPKEYVGLLANSNSTLEGPFIIDAGIKNSTNTGRIISIKGKRFLNIWLTEKANELRGTDGFRIPRGIHLGDTREIFVPQLCRPLKLNATKLSSPQLLAELEAIELEVDVNSQTPEEMYCPLKASGPSCPPRGFFDISQCSVPGNVSPPVFASIPILVKGVSIDPHSQRTAEKFRLLAEPKTGIVVEAHIRLQINVHLQRSVSMADLFANLSDPMYLPMALFENDIVGGQEDLRKLHDALNVSPMRIRFVLCILFVLSMIIIALLLAYIATRHKRSYLRRICCFCSGLPLRKRNSSARNLLSHDPSDSTSIMLSKDSDISTSTNSPWNISIHSSSEEHDESMESSNDNE